MEGKNKLIQSLLDVQYFLMSFHFLTYLDRGVEVKFLPIKVPSLPDDGMIGERITQEVNIVASNLTSEDVTIFLLPTAKEI